MSIKVTQGRETFVEIQVAARQLDETLRRTVRETAALYRARLVAAISGEGSGAFYGRQSGRVVYRRVTRKVELFGGKTGRVRSVARVQRTGIARRASAPGEAPARFTGTLLRSIRTKFPGREKGYGAKVFADRGTAFYRHFLEFGTRERSTRRPRRSVGRLAPRPIFSPLQAALERDLDARVGRAVDLFVAFRGR